MNRFLKGIAMAGLVAGLTACATAPPAEVKYYLLSSSDSQPREISAGESKQVMGIAPVTVADYINTDGLALLSSDNQLRIARHHRWAEKPEHAIARALQTDLSTFLPDTRVDNAQESNSRLWDYRLRLHIDQLHGTEDGEAIISGFWRLDKPDSEEVIASKRFLLKHPLEKPGYGEMVRTLRELIQQLAKELGQQVNQA